MLDLLEQFSEEFREKVQDELGKKGWGKAVNIYKTILPETENGIEKDMLELLQLMKEQDPMTFKNYYVDTHAFKLDIKRFDENNNVVPLYAVYIGLFEADKREKFKLIRN